MKRIFAGSFVFLFSISFFVCSGMNENGISKKRKRDLQDDRVSVKEYLSLENQRPDVWRYFSEDGSTSNSSLSDEEPPKKRRKLNPKVQLPPQLPERNVSTINTMAEVKSVCEEGCGWFMKRFLMRPPEYVNSGLIGADIKKISELSNLEGLKIYLDGRVTVADLAPLRRLRKLVDIEIHGLHWGNLGEFGQILFEQKYLKRLAFCNCDLLENNFFEDLDYNRRLIGLEKISFIDCKNVKAHSILLLKNLKRLEYVRVEGETISERILFSKVKKLCKQNFFENLTTVETASGGMMVVRDQYGQVISIAEKSRVL